MDALKLDIATETTGLARQPHRRAWLDRKAALMTALRAYAGR
jgi:hypothetical protein